MNPDPADRADAVLDPAMAEALARQAQIVAALGPPPEPGIAGERLQAERARAWWNEGGPAVPCRETRLPVGPEGLRVALYTPAAAAPGPRPAYVYLHGGGWRIGSPRANDRQLRELAQAWGGIVASLDYAHMPEARFPVAVEQTADALQWLATHGAAWGIAGDRLAVGGSSAGANVALGAALQAGGVAAGWLRAAACVVGVFDDDTDCPSMQAHGGPGRFPNRAGAAAMFQAYRTDAQRSDPRFDLLRADPAALPPTFLAAAAVDAFHDTSVRLADRLRAAGRPVELQAYAGMTHLFFGYSRTVPAARRCIADLAAFLARHLPAA